MKAEVWKRSEISHSKVFFRRRTSNLSRYQIETPEMKGAYSNGQGMIGQQEELHLKNKGELVASQVTPVTSTR